MKSESTPAIEELSVAGIDFEVVRTQRATSVEESARFQGIEPGRLIKSLLVRRSEGNYLFVLMPGPRQMSWTKLRQHLGVSRLTMPSPEEAKEVSGYERGAITPLGAADRFPVIADGSVPSGTIAIGGGAHGVNIHIDSGDLIQHLAATAADLSE